MSQEAARDAGRRSILILAALAVVAFVLIGWLGIRLGWIQTTGMPKVVALYCFSALDDVMQDRLLPEFRDRWLREHGETVEFVVTFAGSGDITSRILAKYPAEIAIVSSELDAYRLPAAWKSWQELPYNGMMAKTPLVIIVKNGNPKSIMDFGDLGGNGVELLHGDPARSGAAELAILAEYYSTLRRGGDRDLAFQTLLSIWRNVRGQPSTAREARSRFENGEGDAFVTYEADVVGSPSRRRIEGEIVYPVSTVVAEPIVVKIQKNIDASLNRVVDAFVEFLWTRESQQILADYGFLSVFDDLNLSRPSLATIEDPFTLSEVGIRVAQKEVLEGVWKERVLLQLR